MSGYRQAAVALHGLAAEDRGLILAELAQADQSTLRAYLDELNELGFETQALDPGALAATVQAAAPAPDRLAGVSAQTMLALFEAEPAALVAQCLALRDWPWAAPLLALMTPARREAVRAAAPAGARAPARERFLLQALSGRLAMLAPAPVQPPATLLAPLLRLVKSWTR
ncbi:hypothetical protein HSX11_14895 [Oxalobacteraceae bacterium]|nr:hypothetical protein [Oxalobacteraceae bacterium]